MSNQDRSGSKIVRLLSMAGYPALFAALVGVTVAFWRPLVDGISDPEALRAWVEGYGAAAPLAFILVQVVQVVIFAIPGEFPQLAAGYLFGTPAGIAYTLVGAAIGSAIGFLAGRVLGRPFLRVIMSEERRAQSEELIISPRGISTLFLLYLIPGIPKDVLSYIAGIGPIRLWFYLVASTAGRIPGVALSVITGAAAAERKWLLAGIVIGIAVVLFGAGLLMRKQLLNLLQRFARRDQS